MKKSQESCQPKLTHWLAKHFFVPLVFVTSLLSAQQLMNQSLLAKIEAKYGQYAKKRLQAWDRLMDVEQQLEQMAKLKRVNVFFNFVRFLSDRLHWGVEDYWATPVEFLATDGGDCEDYAIAKYFTLKALGIPEKKLQLTYVKAVEFNQAHMVLTYYPSEEAEPLVLDNLIGEIKKASERPDLVPVYSFNGEGLWLAKRRGMGERVGSSSRVSLWTDLLSRMAKEINEKQEK